MNPIIQALNQSKGLNIVSLYKSILTSGNQSEALAKMAEQNGQLGQVVDYVKKNGGNAKSLFYSMAAQQGVDPESILSMLR